MIIFVGGADTLNGGDGDDTFEGIQEMTLNGGLVMIISMDKVET